jgi:hypothetical protein
VPSGLSPFLRFELLNECSEMRGNLSRCRVVLAFEALPNCGQPNASIASRIQPALRERVLKHIPTNPVVDPVGCGSEIAPTSPPPVPRRLTNASTVGRVSDKGKERSPKRKPRPFSEGGVSGTLDHLGGRTDKGSAWETHGRARGSFSSRIRMRCRLRSACCVRRRRSLA